MDASGSFTPNARPPTWMTKEPNANWEGLSIASVILLSIAKTRQSPTIIRYPRRFGHHSKATKAAQSRLCQQGLSLFRFFNLIVEKMISEPKHVDDVYSKLPADKLKAIENRDK